jgi:hypothetical protein
LEVVREEWGNVEVEIVETLREDKKKKVEAGPAGSTR